MRRRLFLFTFVPASALLALAASSAAASGVLLVNESPSLPEGLYRRIERAAPRPGDVVALEPPAEARAYLAGLGMPRTVKLLKRVAATEGQRVCAAGPAVHDERGRGDEGETGLYRVHQPPQLAHNHAGRVGVAGGRGVAAFHLGHDAPA